MLHSINMEGRLVSVSDAWPAKLGYPRAEVLGRLSSDFLTPESREHAIKNVLPEFFRRGHCENVEYQTRAVDLATGWLISPIVAASLCIKPRRLLRAGQAAKIDALKNASPDFTSMRQFAMRFRGLFRSKDIQKFDVWLNDAQQSGIYAIRRFARTIQRDIGAVRNAFTEGWSNGETEGQINRLKPLKRAMYGRAGVELLRAQLLPLHLPGDHRA